MVFGDGCSILSKLIIVCDGGWVSVTRQTFGVVASETCNATFVLAVLLNRHGGAAGLQHYTTMKLFTQVDTIMFQT